MAQNTPSDETKLTERESLQVIAEALMPERGEDHLDITTNLNYIADYLERIAKALEAIAAKLV